MVVFLQRGQISEEADEPPPSPENKKIEPVLQSLEKCLEDSSSLTSLEPYLPKKDYPEEKYSFPLASAPITLPTEEDLFSLYRFVLPPPPEEEKYLLESTPSPEKEESPDLLTYILRYSLGAASATNDDSLTLFTEDDEEMNMASKSYFAQLDKKSVSARSQNSLRTASSLPSY